ncbi:MAG: MBL fold metallo-hydrolase [Candidatus Azambacteria bacterium]|nr:MBL fold metallo-hydrolase [Candidatus Azambacteria bacterium]
MTISWYGEACFLLESGGTRVLVEPPQKKSGINPPRLKSDILIYSKSQDLNKQEGETFIIDGPGEYEIKGINILGIADPSTSSGQANTIYNIEVDGVKICHLGFLNNDLDNETLALIDDPDIALVPVGGGDVLDAEAAMKLINKIEPSIAIPMLYVSPADFLKESEAKEPSQPKLTIKKKDINEEETKIVILNKV